MAMGWDKAGYGKTVSKSGGGKLQTTSTKGDRGIPSGCPGKASIGRVKSGIDTPMTKGDKGIPPMSSRGGSKKAPRD